MRIAVAYENGFIFQHFGHTELFKFYDVQDGKIISTSLENTNGSGHGALAKFLAENNVNTLICGGIGGGAQIAVAQAGIALFAGVNGDADNAVESLLNGTLSQNSNPTCDHHDESHSCGEHSCGGKC